MDQVYLFIYMLELEAFMHGLLRRIQLLPQESALCTFHILLRTLPVEAFLDYQVLGLFGRILRLKNAKENDILWRQLALKDSGYYPTFYLLSQKTVVKIFLSLESIREYKKVCIFSTKTSLDLRKKIPSPQNGSENTLFFFSRKKVLFAPPKRP